MKIFFTVREVAHHLKINEDDVMTLIKEGKVSAYHLGGECLRLRREDILKWTPPLFPLDTPSEVTSSYKKPLLFFFSITGLCIITIYLLFDQLLHFF